MPAVFRADCGYSEKHLEGTVKTGKITSQLTSCIRKKNTIGIVKILSIIMLKNIHRNYLSRAPTLVFYSAFILLTRGDGKNVWAKCFGIIPFLSGE